MHWRRALDPRRRPLPWHQARWAALPGTHPKPVYLASMATVVGPTMQAPPATMPNTPLMKPVTGTKRSSMERALA